MFQPRPQYTLILVYVLLLCSASKGLAQDPNTPPVSPGEGVSHVVESSEAAAMEAEPAVDTAGGFRRLVSSLEFWLSLLVIVFGLVVVFVQLHLLGRQDFDSNDVLKVFSVTVILVGTLFLISAGFSDQQIAPAMGLFGTIAGYLIGKGLGSGDTTKASKAQSSPPHSG